MKIYLIRHTDAEDDARDSYGGVSEDALIEKGKKYANEVGKELKTSGIQTIFTSPCIRAKQTAEIINKHLKTNIKIIYGLRERNSYGVISGLTKKEGAKTMPRVHLRIQEMKARGEKPSKSYETLPGAESFLDLLMRLEASFDEIFNSGLKIVAVVTHGGFCWALFKEVLKLDKEPEKGEVVILSGTSLKNLKIFSN